jgi:hypothetical protein
MLIYTHLFVPVYNELVCLLQCELYKASFKEDITLHLGSVSQIQTSCATYTALVLQLLNMTYMPLVWAAVTLIHKRLQPLQHISISCTIFSSTDHQSMSLLLLLHLSVTTHE